MLLEMTATTNKNDPRTRQTKGNFEEDLSFMKLLLGSHLLSKRLVNVLLFHDKCNVLRITRLKLNNLGGRSFTTFVRQWWKDIDYLSRCRSTGFAGFFRLFLTALLGIF